MFTSKTYMALLIILELSHRREPPSLTSAELAAQYSISRRYLEVVFARLAKAGIVESKRGTAGGYQLSADLRQLSLFDLALVAEGGLNLLKAGDRLKAEGRTAGVIRVANALWDRIESDLNERLQAISVGEIVAELSDTEEMYFI